MKRLISKQRQISPSVYITYVGVNFDFRSNIRPLLFLSGSEQSGHVVSVQVVVLLDLPEPECQLPHPIDATPHARRRDVHVVGGRRRPETVGREIVVCQILSVVVAAHVVDVDLVAFLKVVEEETRVGHRVDQVLHFLRQIMQVSLILVVLAGEGAGEQRVEENDGFVEVPDEHAVVVGLVRIGALAVTARFAAASATAIRRLAH